MSIKLPFGLNESDSLVHIAEAENGKQCGCVCPSCRSPLVAVNRGTKRQPHFRHDGGVECVGGLESAIHFAAKQVLLESKYITLPEYIAALSASDSRGVKHTEQETIVPDSTVISFDFVQEEKQLNGIVADILATKGDTQLVVEIFFRHKVDEHKLAKIIQANKSAIEIDLSDLKPADVKDWKAFRSCVINQHQRVKWLHNAKAKRFEKKLQDRLAAKVREQEERYKHEEEIRQKREKEEKAQLIQALRELTLVSSDDFTKQLRQAAKEHPAWRRTKKFLRYSLHELPDFLNVDVPNGDWVFGCDRRVWQAAFYSAFIRHKGKAFTVRMVDDWLQNKQGCKVLYCAKTVGIYGRKYPYIVPVDIVENLPSSWKTLKVYFNHLEGLGMLEYSGPDKGHPGSCWYKVVEKKAKREVSLL